MAGDEIENKKSGRSGNKSGGRNESRFDNKSEADKLHETTRVPMKSVVCAVENPTQTVKIESEDDYKTTMKVMTRLLVKNLAESVTQEDIEELFEQYEPDVARLHFGPTGKSLGTAEVVVDSEQAARIKENLHGCLLDDAAIEIMELSAATAPKKVSVFNRIQKISKKNVFKPSSRSS